MECSKSNSYSSYDVVSLHGVDIGSAGVAAVDQDSGEIRYGSWKFVFADYVTEGGSEGFDYCAVKMLPACRDCYCYYYCEPALGELAR